MTTNLLRRRKTKTEETVEEHFAVTMAAMEEGTLLISVDYLRIFIGSLEYRPNRET